MWPFDVMDTKNKTSSALSPTYSESGNQTSNPHADSDCSAANLTELTEEEVSELVHNALARARKATTPRRSPSQSPRSRNGKELPPPPAHSPLNDHMHSILSPANDSEVASRVYSASSSDDIIRRVEEEIANARKAADEAQRRLLDALSNETGGAGKKNGALEFSPSMELADVLDDDELRGILDVSLHEEGNGDVSFFDATTMIAKEFASESALRSENFKSMGVEVEAQANQSAQVVDPEQPMDDEESEYTEETVSDDESEYTEETATTVEIGVGQSAAKASGSIPMKVDNKPPTPPARIPSTTTKNIWWTQDNEIADASDGNPKPEGSGTVSDADDIVDAGEIPMRTARKDATSQSKTRTPKNRNEGKLQRKAKAKNSDRQNIIEERDMSAEVLQLVDANSRNIEFRFPYPLPAPLPKPRPSEQIISDHTIGPPKPFSRWAQPKRELKELLQAAEGPSLARRSNACGALKVLSMKEKNQLTLVRKQGFLQSLVHAVQADIPSKDREIALDARSRAVMTILKVSEPKDNRVIIFNHPGLPECLVKAIQDDKGEARVNACGTLAMLAKTPENREGMVNVENLVDTLARVVDRTVDLHLTNRLEEEKKEDLETKVSCEDPSRGDVGSHAFTDDSTVPSDEEQSLTVGSESLSLISVPSGGHEDSVPHSIRKKNKEKKEEYLSQSRLNACATLMHLSKHCSILDTLCNNKCLIECLAIVSLEFDNPIHTRCLEIICNLSRFPGNTAAMSECQELIETLVRAGKSKSLDDRVFALRSLQNLSANPKGKIVLSNALILTLLSISAMRSDYEEHFAAVATLYNLSTEPGVVVPLTNTKNVVATLVHLAHNTDSHPVVRQMACDALATIGLWLQTLARAGKVPKDVTKVLLPSHTTTGWQRWQE